MTSADLTPEQALRLRTAIAGQLRYLNLGTGHAAIMKAGSSGGNGTRCKSVR